MKMKSFARTIGTILLVLSILLVVSCKQEKEKPAEITPEQGQEVVEIGTNIVNSVDLKTLKIDATGGLVLNANLKVQNGNQEYFEIKDAIIQGCVAEYKKGTSTEPGIGNSSASATIVGKKVANEAEKIEIPVTVSVAPKETEGGTITAGTIKIGTTTFKVEDEPEDEDILAAFSAMKTEGIIIAVEDEHSGDTSYELNEDLIKKYGEGNVNATLKDVGLVFYGTAKDGTAYSAKLALDGTIAVEAEAPKAEKRAASIDSNIDLTIKISYGDSNSEFTMKFQEKKSTNDVEGLIDYIEEALDNDLTLESAKALMAEIGLTTTPRYATINGVEVDATSYLNFLIDFAIQATSDEEEPQQEL